MKHAISFMLLAAAISVPALADWVPVFRYSDAELYVAPSGIDRVKDKARIWTLTDATEDKEALGYRYHSQKTLRRGISRATSRCRCCIKHPRR